MKREEKNQQTRRRIMDSALAEFSAQGYGASSINTICAAQDVSKGIVYHYFETKDALFLACVEECFQSLKAYIQDHVHPDGGAVDTGECLTDYFGVRMRFFRENPLYQRIFMESVFMPPEHLKAGIMERRQPMEQVNLEILKELFSRIPLRGHLDRENTAKLLIQFINFINLQDHGVEMDLAGIRQVEEKNRQILDIFLNGILER